MRKALISLPEADLRAIDAAAERAGETRSAFLRRAALAEVRRASRPVDDPAVRRAWSRLLARGEASGALTTARALAARDRGRR